MSSNSRGIEMVRIEAEERVFDREAILGRDTTSVFPSLASTSTTTSTPMVDAIKLNKKFVTESQLFDEIKATKSTPSDDCKPLYQVLIEAKERKEQEFQEQWAEMKIGKNRPLDAEEYEFLSRIDEEQRLGEAKRKREERDELEAFKKLQSSGGGESTSAVLAAEAATTGLGIAGDANQQRAAAIVARRPKSAKVVVVKPKVTSTGGATTANADKPVVNLFGDYGSDSDS
jgi:hypothetical protein